MGPFIDTSVLLLDPMFADTFSVVQRIQTVDSYGETTTQNIRTDGIIGPVTPAKPAELRRVPETERGHRTLTIFTQARLNGPAVGRQPDLVIWRGDNFIVKEVLPWTSYGPGWVRVIATSIDAVEAVT